MTPNLQLPCLTNLARYGDAKASTVPVNPAYPHLNLLSPAGACNFKTSPQGNITQPGENVNNCNFLLDSSTGTW